MRGYSVQIFLILAHLHLLAGSLVFLDLLWRECDLFKLLILLRTNLGFLRLLEILIVKLSIQVIPIRSLDMF